MQVRIRKTTNSTIAVYLLLILSALVMLLPFAWMISASLKLDKDVFSFPNQVDPL